MTKDERRATASAIVSALIAAGHMEERGLRRKLATVVVSAKLAEIDRCEGSCPQDGVR